MKQLIVSLSLMSMLFIACSKDKPTQPVQNGTLLLSRLVVSMVPGGSESIAIHATDANGSYSECTVTNGNPGIATATITDSTLEVLGVSIGVDTLTISNGNGKICTLPVQVYDCHVLDTGELLITYADIYSDLGPVAGVRTWRPYPPEGYFILGDFVTSSMINQHQHAVMVVKAKPGSDAIAFTQTYENSVGQWGWEFKRPVPPAGYVAMGTFMSYWGVPESTACIREDLTVMGDTGTVYGQYASKFWSIDIPVGDESHESAYLAPGSFIYNETGIAPRTDPLMRVLKVDLPMLAEAPMQEFMPSLTDYDEPPMETAPRMAKAMLVPSSIINDLQHVGYDGVGWKVANSPFYRLERQVYYKRLYHYYNNGTVIQPNTVAMAVGITTTESQRIWNETEISIAVETGLSFKVFSGKLTATVSRKFGYESQTSIAELIERTLTQGVSTPPGKASALWQKYNKYILYRHNGINLEAVSTWEVGIDSYFLDEYPDN